MEDERQRVLSAASRSLIFQALGMASLCWDPVPSGQYDADAAIEIGDALIDELEKTDE